MKNPPIVLMSDFGIADPYQAMMKGIILKINTLANIIDLTHEIEPGCISQAAFLLSISYQCFPRGSVFVAVIDPTVGSKRRAIAAKIGNYTFFVPDNGILTFIHEKNYIEFAVELNNPDFHNKTMSHTFHGRDIFAPTAAFFSKGVEMTCLGSEIDVYSIVKLPGLKSIVSDERHVAGEVMHIDRFGNLITSLHKDIFTQNEERQRNFSFFINDTKITGLVNSYSDVADGELLAYIGSTGYLEIGKRNSSAALALKCKIGSEIEGKKEY